MAVPSVIEQTISAHELQGRKAPRPPEPLTTAPQEIEVFGNFNTRLEALRKLILDNLVNRLPEIQRMVDVHEDAIRHDQYYRATRVDQDWTELVAAILRNLNVLAQIPEGQYLEMSRLPATVTSTRNLVSLQRQIKSLLGVDVFSGFDPRSATAVNGMVQASVAKIKTIEAAYFSEIEETVLREFRAGTRHEVIAEDISERFKVSQKRARVIARDQISKLNGDLTKQRQTRLGVKSYIWRTAGDERVRSSHMALNGKRFAWNKPPAVGHPGQPIQCRCFADPDIDELLE